MNDDVIVFADPDGVHYVAQIGERWYRWPAVFDGWGKRAGMSTKIHESCYELEPKLGELALRLSGVVQ